MIHNGIEYGMMQAYAEGFTIMEKKKTSRWTCRRSRKYGATAAWCAVGCSI
jgi:6-phosphogluconate dehydrogenase (decarboxylating)